MQIVTFLKNEVIFFKAVSGLKSKHENPPHNLMGFQAYNKSYLEISTAKNRLRPKVKTRRLVGCEYHSES